jgi:hypothetical protein
MNPFSLYEHKPQLVQSMVVVAGVWLFRRERRANEPELGWAGAAIAWAGLGALDWAAYSFAGLTADEMQSVGQVLAWLQVGAVIWGVAGLMAARVASRRAALSTPAREPDD